jgi:hypothetical protein
MTRTSVIAAAVALTVGACGSSDKPKPAAGKPAASVPYGTYVRNVTKADLERTSEVRNATSQERGSHQSLPPTGEYRLVLAKSEAGDVIKVVDATDFAIPMYVEAKDGVFALDDYVDPNKGAFCGPEVAVKANYRYELDGDSLRIEASPADGCADRDSMLTGTWKKS